MTSLYTTEVQGQLVDAVARRMRRQMPIDETNRPRLLLGESQVKKSMPTDLASLCDGFDITKASRIDGGCERGRISPVMSHVLFCYVPAGMRVRALRRDQRIRRVRKQLVAAFDKETTTVLNTTLLSVRNAPEQSSECLLITKFCHILPDVAASGYFLHTSGASVISSMAVIQSWRYQQRF